MAKTETATKKEGNEEIQEISEVNPQEFFKGGLRKNPAEMKRVSAVAFMIAEGNSDNDIMEYLNEEYGINKRYGRRYITAALDYLFPDGVVAMRDEIMKRNVVNLFRIIDIGLENRQYLAQSNKAIDTLNKMIGAYENEGIKIGIKNDTENNTQEFVIKLGE